MCTCTGVEKLVGGGGDMKQHKVGKMGRGHTSFHFIKCKEFVFNLKSMESH